MHHNGAPLARDGRVLELSLPDDRSGYISLFVCAAADWTKLSIKDAVEWLTLIVNCCPASNGDLKVRAVDVRFGEVCQVMIASCRVVGVSLVCRVV